MSEEKKLSELIAQNEEENEQAPVEASEVELEKETRDVSLYDRDEKSDEETEKVKDFTPPSARSNLSEFINSVDKEVEEAKQLAEKYTKEKELEEMNAAIEEEKKQEFNDIEEEEESSDNNEDESSEDDIPPIDLTSVVIKKPKDPIKTFGNLRAKSREIADTTKVILSVSGYTASMMGMSSPEIRNYSSTLAKLDTFGAFEYQYKTLYNKIKETSIGDMMTYETFLKRTALLETEILNFGLFSSSYPDVNEYPYTCPKCGAKDTFKFDNQQYLDINEKDGTKKQEMLDTMLNVLKGQATDPAKLFEEGLTNKLVRKYLKDSKIIVELRHPTLYDQLYDVVQNLTEDLINENGEVIEILPYVSDVYIPTEETKDNEVPEYYKCPDTINKIWALNSLDDADDEALAKAIDKNILSKYKVTYSLKAPKCKACGNEPAPEPVQFASMLFMMRQIRIINNK